MQVLLDYREAGGSYSIKFVAPGTLLFTCQGKVSKDAVGPIISALEKGVGDHCPRLFVDFFDLVAYDSSLRERAVTLLAPKKIDEIHIGVRSSLVRMGVTLASMVLKQIRSHADRPTFDAAMATRK